MQSVSSRIWTLIAVSISCDDNHYTTGTSNVMAYSLMKEEKHHNTSRLSYGLMDEEKKNNTHTRRLIYSSHKLSKYLSNPSATNSI